MIVWICLTILGLDWNALGQTEDHWSVQEEENYMWKIWSASSENFIYLVDLHKSCTLWIKRYEIS